MKRVLETDDAAVRELSLPLPDDMHHHLRDGEVLADTVAAAARQFGRAICMPNLVPPVTTAEMATAYKGRILEALRSRTAEGARVTASAEPGLIVAMSL